MTNISHNILYFKKSYLETKKNSKRNSSLNYYIYKSKHTLIAIVTIFNTKTLTFTAPPHNLFCQEIHRVS